MSFPGSQRNKMEFFIYHLYAGHPNQHFAREQIYEQALKFAFANELLVYFRNLPAPFYTEPELIAEVNKRIAARGRAHAIGGTVSLLTHVPEAWEAAWQHEYAAQYGPSASFALHEHSSQGDSA